MTLVHAERRARSRHRPQSLLERLRRDDSGEGALSSDPTSDRVRSIRQSLVRLLNSRRGSALATPDYGLSDFNDASIGSSDMLNIISRDIQRTIVQFEPRVQDVRVQCDKTQSSGLELEFVISARTKIQNKDEHVLIDLVLKEGRNFSLKK